MIGSLSLQAQAVGALAAQMFVDAGAAEDAVALNFFDDEDTFVDVVGDDEEKPPPSTWTRKHHLVGIETCSAIQAPPMQRTVLRDLMTNFHSKALFFAADLPRLVRANHHHDDQLVVQLAKSNRAIVFAPLKYLIDNDLFDFEAGN